MTKKRDLPPEPPPAKPKPPKPQGNRRVYSPEIRKMVETMAGYGIAQRDIAKSLKIAYNTLRKHFAEELERGVINTNFQVQESLFKKATGEGQASVTAAIYWTKVRCGWKEPPQSIRHSGTIGSYDLTKLSDEQLQQLETLLGPLADDPGNKGREGPPGVGADQKDRGRKGR